jgi:hypothetical protein
MDRRRNMLVVPVVLGPDLKIRGVPRRLAIFVAIADGSSFEKPEWPGPDLLASTMIKASVERALFQ